MLLLILPALYVGGYFALPKRAEYILYSSRTFPSKFIADAYIPLGFIESRLRHREIIFHFSPSDGYNGMEFEADN